MFLLTKDQLQDTANSQIADRLLLKSENTSNASETTHSTIQQEADEAKSCENNNRAESKELQKLKLIAKEKQEVKEEEVDEDGFRTPTSLDKKIPEAKQCPAPPRKPKPSLKRKDDHYSHHTSSFTTSSSSRENRNPPLDLSIEVQLLLFQTQHNNPLSSYYHHKNPKKSRTRECPK